MVHMTDHVAPQSYRCIVTGGSGFLGHHLITALIKAGHQVVNIDIRTNPNYPTLEADIRDRERMRQLITDADVVFHLAGLIEAGESVKKPDLYVDHNITGTLSVLEAMRENKVPVLIFSSSAAIYGEPISTPIKEDDRTLPINPYGVTKLAMEGLLRSYVENFGMTGVALRYFNLYGREEHHQPETHAIPRFINQILNEEPVTVWGDGQYQRDFIYIDDIVTAHLQALEFSFAHPAKYHYFNLSTQRAASVMEIIHLLESLLNKQATISHRADRPGDPRVLVADATKARERLGWQAQTSLESGLRATVAYFLKIQNHNTTPV